MSSEKIKNTADELAKNEAFQMPKKFQSLVDDKDKVDRGIEAQKKRLEKQLNDRKHYVGLLEEYLDALKYYEKNPQSDKIKKIIEMAKVRIDRHNLEIEIVAQQHIFVDTYVYYKEDFMKRYKAGGGKKQSIFKK